MRTPNSLTAYSDQEWAVGAARANLRGFLHYVGPSFAYAWDARHIRFLCDQLMAVERGDIKRLMVFMPPRHRKSQTANAHFAAWYLGRHPDHHVITASYGDALAKRFSRQARGLIREYGHELFGVTLSEESQAVEHWQLAGHYGGLAAVGVGGPITGTGADLLIIDDPHKNRQEANSQTFRDQIWDWYTNDATTRLEPEGSVILIQTRWHEDDLAGRLLRAQELGEGDEWTVIRLPAFAEADDALGRPPGEVLWPEQFPFTIMEATRRRIGTRAFTSLYQQRPRELQGGVFQAAWLHWYTRDEIVYNALEDEWRFRDQPLRLFMGVDLATTEKTASDDFAIVVIGTTPDQQVVVLEIVAAQLDPAIQAQTIADVYRDWLPDRVTIEDNGGQKYLVSEVRHWHQLHPECPAIPVSGKTNTTDKFSRISRMAPLVEAGHLWLRAALPTEEGGVDLDRLPHLRIHQTQRKLYEQLVTFAPKMAHEDVADALDLAVGAARMHRWLEAYQDDITPHAEGHA